VLPEQEKATPFSSHRAQSSSMPLPAEAYITDCTSPLYMPAPGMVMVKYVRPGAHALTFNGTLTKGMSGLPKANVEHAPPLDVFNCSAIGAPLQSTAVIALEFTQDGTTRRA